MQVYGSGCIVYRAKRSAKGDGVVGKPRIDLTGQRFGRLVAIEPAGSGHNGGVVWRCQCDCGQVCQVEGYRLRKGVTQSCGCLRRERGKATYRRNKKFCEQMGNSASLFTDDGRAKAALVPGTRNHSGVVGVSWEASTARWVARLTFHGKLVLQERCATFEDAVQARRAAERQYFGRQLG